MVIMASSLVKNGKGLSGLCPCKCCFQNLLVAKWLTGVTWGTLTCGCCFYRREKFLVAFYKSCFKKLVFLQKAIMGCMLLNASLKLLVVLNMCQCLINSYIFGSTGLYVLENGIQSLCFDLQYFKNNDLSGSSPLSKSFLTVDSLQPFSTYLFINTRPWKCFLYSSKVEQMRLILSA